MEMKAGYKKTEVGVIPEEWQVNLLRECCKKITDGTHDTPTPTRTGIPFLTAIHVKDNRADFERCLFLPQCVHDIIYKRCNPERDDVMMVNIGAGVATTALVNVDYEFSLKNVALLKPDSNVLSGPFLNSCLSQLKQSIVTSLLSGGAQPFLSLTQIGNISIPLPPIPEQHSIEGALGDVDGLLGGLEKLIAKKRDLKQAAMQQLLTGKIRLPGFAGKWEVKPLGDVAEIKKGQLITEKDTVPGNVPVIAGGKNPAYYHNKANRNGKTITISASGANAGYVAFYEPPIFASDCSTISEGVGYVLEFIYFQLLLNQEKIFKMQTGGAQPHIHPVDLIPLELNIPNVFEQTAIAAVLSDMDAELAALEQRLTKTRALKQGMMQELLTGRTKIV